MLGALMHVAAAICITLGLTRRGPMLLWVCAAQFHFAYAVPSNAGPRLIACQDAKKPSDAHPGFAARIKAVPTPCRAPATFRFGTLPTHTTPGEPLPDWFANAAPGRAPSQHSAGSEGPTHRTLPHNGPHFGVSTGSRAGFTHQPDESRGLDQSVFLPRTPNHTICLRKPLGLWATRLQSAALDKQAEATLGQAIDRVLAFGGTSLGFTTRQLHALFRPSFVTSGLQAALRSAPKSVQPELLALAQCDGSDLPGGLVCFTDGSFTAGRPGVEPACGWACVFLDRCSQTCDVISGEVPDWGRAADGRSSAFCAECWALIVALWIGVSATQGTSLSIFSDCQSALSIAKGETAVSTDGVAQVLGHVAGCCRDVAFEGPHLLYVPGHQGATGNELADKLAKAAAAGHAAGRIAWNRPGDPDWWHHNGVKWAWAGVVTRWSKGDDALPSPVDADLSANRHHGDHEQEDFLAPFLPSPAVASGEFRVVGTCHLESYSIRALMDLCTAPQRSFDPTRLCLLAAFVEDRQNLSLDRP